MPGVFVNYRTGDGEWAAALVKRELSARFGVDQVFYASQSIRLGEDFSREILSGLRRCEVLLALIGPRWVNATDREGVRRLDNPDDWVRREILEAFQCGLRVIPVLMDGIDPLREDDLPDVLRRVARCQYLRIHHRSDDLDLPRLVDELVELVPELVKAPAAPARVPQSAKGELRSPVTEFRQALTEPAEQTVHDRVQVAATAALELLTESRYPTTGHVDDSELPAALEKRLTGYEHDLASLLRLVAIGVRSGDRRHDDVWVNLVERFLHPRETPPRGAHEVWVSATAYPALLLVYVVGVAAVAAGREDLVHRLLCQTKVTSTDGRTTPVLRALALRNVVDPRHAAALPAWGGAPPHQALSVHLRQVLSRVFFNIVDGSAFDWSFADYECLRSLLELHDAPFSSLGEFAVRLDQDDAVIYQRNAARLDADSVLLRAGAFDGDPNQAAAAWRELRQATRARYS